MIELVFFLLCRHQMYTDQLVTRICQFFFLVCLSLSSAASCPLPPPRDSRLFRPRAARASSAGLELPRPARWRGHSSSARRRGQRSPDLLCAAAVLQLDHAPASLRVICSLLAGMIEARPRADGSIANWRPSMMKAWTEVMRWTANTW